MIVQHRGTRPICWTYGDFGIAVAVFVSCGIVAAEKNQPSKETLAERHRIGKYILLIVITAFCFIVACVCIIDRHCAKKSRRLSAGRLNNVSCQDVDGGAQVKAHS
mmetsp:Transcript_54568/g.84842  ORF Transcript_54568/g.84842 Transcript_54568/m.84842 type:complete len:106 (-) Transcript_54568:128-445(-)